MRIGEILLGGGLVTAEQLSAALHNQQQFGGRLGTSLIELGYVSADNVARALSGQHRVPAVLGKHVAAVDAKVIALLPASMAQSHNAIPLGYTQTKPPRLVVAFMDPSATPMEEIAFLTGARIDAAVAPEHTIRQCLARYYGIAQPESRYVDVNFAAIRPGSSPPPPPPPNAQAIRVSSSLLSMPPLPATEIAEPPSSRPPPREDTIPERRPETEPPPEDDWETFTPQTAPPGMLAAVLGYDDAAFALQAAKTRDEVGDLMTDYLRSTFGCGLVLIAKGGMALGWKGFALDADAAVIESIALPLGSPSMLSIAHNTRAVFRGAPPEEGSTIQSRLWKLLRCSPPSEVLVAPIVMANRVVNLVYAQPEEGARLAAGADEELARVCAIAAEEYARLIREKTKGA